MLPGSPGSPPPGVPAARGAGRNAVSACCPLARHETASPAGTCWAVRPPRSTRCTQTLQASCPPGRPGRPLGVCSAGSGQNPGCPDSGGCVGQLPGNVDQPSRRRNIGAHTTACAHTQFTSKTRKEHPAHGLLHPKPAWGHQPLVLISFLPSGERPPSGKLGSFLLHRKCVD